MKEKQTALDDAYAYHEAGHAMMAILLDEGVDWWQLKNSSIWCRPISTAPRDTLSWPERFASLASEWAGNSAVATQNQDQMWRSINRF